MQGCAICRWLCNVEVQNHLVHNVKGHGVGMFMHGIHLEPVSLLLWT